MVTEEKEERVETFEDKLLNFLNKTIMIVGTLFMLVKVMQAVN